MNSCPVLVLSIWLAAVFKGHALMQGEPAIIAKCLENFGGLTTGNIERLGRFKEWSVKNEEVPCFSQCYADIMLGIYDKETGFNEEAIVKIFGRAVYNACRERLSPNEDHIKSSCEHAFAGFHCITLMWDDPFVIIEKLSNVTDAAKTALKDCLHSIDESERIHLVKYAGFPVVEPIPCFTRCFISKLKLFDERTRRWQLAAMRRALGVPLVGAHVNGCHQKRSRNPCSTIYQQFTCYILAK